MDNLNCKPTCTKGLYSLVIVIDIGIFMKTPRASATRQPGNPHCAQVAGRTREITCSIMPVVILTDVGSKVPGDSIRWKPTESRISGTRFKAASGRQVQMQTPGTVEAFFKTDSRNRIRQEAAGLAAKRCQRNLSTTHHADIL